MRRRTTPGKGDERESNVADGVHDAMVVHHLRHLQNRTAPRPGERGRHRRQGYGKRQYEQQPRPAGDPSGPSEGDGSPLRGKDQRVARRPRLVAVAKPQNAGGRHQVRERMRHEQEPQDLQCMPVGDDATGERRDGERAETRKRKMGGGDPGPRCAVSKQRRFAEKRSEPDQAADEEDPGGGECEFFGQALRSGEGSLREDAAGSRN